MADDLLRPDESFGAQVVAALKLLYDFPALLQHPLARAIAPESVVPDRRGDFLRDALLDAVKALSPSPGTPFDAPSARMFNAVRLRYIEGCTVREVSEELAISERQAHREVRRGESAVAAVLWARYCQEAAGEALAQSESLDHEIERLRYASQDTSLRQALERAVAAIAPLVEATGAVLSLPAVDDCLVRADVAGLRQCLIAVLSYAAQCTAATVDIDASPETGQVRLCCTCEPGALTDRPALQNLAVTAEALAEAIGGSFQVLRAEAKHRLLLGLPLSTRKTLLVVDDNEGLLDLIERYLSQTACRVVGTTDPAEGTRLAGDLRPQAMILDILMPGTDGWELLTAIKKDPATAELPVIVCSVFNDPHLARALGAAAFVAKPFSRADLLQVLRSLSLV